MAAIQQSLVWPLLIVVILLSPASDATTSKSRGSSGPASEIRNHYSTLKEGELSGSRQAQSCSVGDPGCQEEGQQPLESAARRYSSQDGGDQYQVESTGFTLNHASADGSNTKSCSSLNGEDCKEEDHPVTVTEHFSSSMTTESACDHMHEADIQQQSVPQAVISEHPKFHLLIQKPVSILERITDVKGSPFVNRILKDEHGSKVKEIVHDYRGCLRCQVEEVFKRWLNGDGMTPITWNTLIKALKDTGLHALADDICSYVSKDALFRPAEPVPKTSHYSYSANILRETYRNHEVELVLTGFNSTIPFLDIMLKNVTTGTIMPISDFNFDEVYRLSIAGQPGTGKTVLLWHLAKKWADYEVLQSCEILLLVDLVSLPTSKSYSTLKDFFEALAGYKNLNIGQLADEIDSRNGSKACFLIDDYTHVHNSYLVKILFYDRLPLSRIISTSKSHTTSKKSISEYIELLGYRDEDLNGHLSKLCKDKKVRKSVLTVWKEQPTIREMSRLPLHLAMIIDIIWSDHARLDRKTVDIELKVQTRTNIYLSFMNQKLERNKIYSSIRHCILKQNHDPAECKTFNTMLTIAFEMVFNDTNTLDYDPTVQSSLAKTGLVTITKLDTQIHGKTQALCVFSHPTFRDFFAAFYMTTLPLDQQLAYITMYGKDVAFSNIWLFYFGLLNMYGYQADVAVLLKRYSAHYSHRYSPGNSFRLCDFEFETQLLTVVREMYRAEQSHKGFNKLLRESGIVVKSSTCLQHDSRYEASLRDKEFVEHFFSQVYVSFNFLWI